MKKEKVLQGQQNVAVSYLRSGKYHKTPSIKSSSCSKKPTPKKLRAHINNYSLKRVLWASSDIHMPIIRQGKITKDEDVKRPNT